MCQLRQVAQQLRGRVQVPWQAQRRHQRVRSMCCMQGGGLLQQGVPRGALECTLETVRGDACVAWDVKAEAAERKARAFNLSRFRMEQPILFRTVVTSSVDPWCPVGEHPKRSSGTIGPKYLDI